MEAHKEYAFKKEQEDILTARIGGHFQRVLADPSLAQNGKLMFQALDALEKRVEALEAK